MPARLINIKYITIRAEEVASPATALQGHHFVQQLRHPLTIGKNLLNSNTSTCAPQHGELRSTNGWHLLASLGQPRKFQPVSRLGFVTAPTSLNAGQQNCRMFGRLLSWYTIYTFWGLLPPSGILPAGKFTASSLAFSLAALLHVTPAAAVSQT